MFKKILSLVIAFLFICNELVYPVDNTFLSSPSAIQDGEYAIFIYNFFTVIDYLRTDTVISSEALKNTFGVDVMKDNTGVWLVKENWKIRVYEAGKAGTPKLETGDELIYEEEVNDKIKLEIYFRGLKEEDRDAIRAHLISDLNVSGLAKMVLLEIAGIRETGVRQIVRRKSAEENEKLGSFLKQIVSPEGDYSEAVKAVTREIGGSIDDAVKKALKNYVELFTRRMNIKDRKDKQLTGEQDLFILKTLSDLENERVYKSVVKVFSGIIGKKKRLIIVSPRSMARIYARNEGVKEKSVDSSGLLSFTLGDTIYFNSGARLIDLVIYITHEVMHLYGAEEYEARKTDREVLSVLKGMIEFLRKATAKDREVNGMLNLIADVAEYELLGYELDLQTAKLQVSAEGMRFLERFNLASINIMPSDEAYVREVKKASKGIIKPGTDVELFTEVQAIVDRGQSERMGVRLFWAFMKYVRRVLNEKITEKKVEEEEEEILEERGGPEPLIPLYEKNVLGYVMKESESRQRLDVIVKNPKVPLFIRVNEAILIDMFSESEDAEFKAVESLRDILEKQPIAVLQILEELRNKRSVELISDFLTHKDPNVRRTASKALYNIAIELLPMEIFDSPKTMKNLLECINKPEIDGSDEDLGAVLKIIAVLSIIRYKDAIPVFLDIIEKNKSEKTRMYVANALGAIGDESIVSEVKKRIYREDDTFSVELVISCLEEIPNNDSADIIVKTFFNTQDKKIRVRCLEALQKIISKKRISTDIMAGMIAPLMIIAAKNKKMSELNFVLGRIASIAIQEGKLDVFEKIDKKVVRQWTESFKDGPEKLAVFGMGLIHDTFTDISDIKEVDNRNPLAGIFKAFLGEMVGDWNVIIEFMQEMRDDIYMGRKEYKDDIWVEVAKKMSDVNPNKDLILGRQWFQRMCMGFCYRSLIDTWDIGKIEDRDYILELMVLRSSFVPTSELPEGAIGATEAIYGDYVVLDDSLFATPIAIPTGVDTVWHEATHLLSAMGVASIGDIDLLGASSHSSIELYLLSKMLNLPDINGIIDRLKKDEPIEDILRDYIKSGVPESYIWTIKSILEGMAVRDKAKGPSEAFFMSRNINPSNMRKTKRSWKRNILKRFSKINTEVIEVSTIRGKKGIIVHTYYEGERFSGYAHRIGVETGFYNAANIYLELLVRYRLSPSQSEFVSRMIAKFMTQEQGLIDRIKKDLREKYRSIPAGEVEKWVKKYVAEKIKALSLTKSANIDLWITYEDLNKLIDAAYEEIKTELGKSGVQKEIIEGASKGIGDKRRVFKIIRPAYQRSESGKTMGNIKDVDGVSRPAAVYKLSNPRYLEVAVDFGLKHGEEPYAYIDTATKTIKYINPSDSRIELAEISALTNIEGLSVDNGIVVDALEQKQEPMEEALVKIIKERIKGLGKRKILQYGIFSALVLSLLITSFAVGHLIIAPMAVAGISVAIYVFRFLKKNRIFYEDEKYRLSDTQRKEMQENIETNRTIRTFLSAIEDGNIIMDDGKVFKERDLSGLFLVYSKDELIDIFEKDFEMDRKAAARIVKYGFKVLEFRVVVSIKWLNHVMIFNDSEDIIADIARGKLILPSKGRLSKVTDLLRIITFKRIGPAEILSRMKRGRGELLNILNNSYLMPSMKRVSEYLIEEISNILFDIYESMENKEDINEFVEKMIQLDISDYMNPPTAKHMCKAMFKEKGQSFITTDVKVFDAVLDDMGMRKGLDFIRQAARESEDDDLYKAFLIYSESFKIGPDEDEYMPMQIEDAWINFNLWRKRSGLVTYNYAQIKLVELYARYIRNAKEDIPVWGWTFLWLGYYKKGTRMYNAVSELLNNLTPKMRQKNLTAAQDVNIILLIDELSQKYQLSDNERQQLLFAAPINGFITLLEIYCKEDIEWGNSSLLELEKRMKRGMNAVVSDDLEGDDLFDEDVGRWLYTMKNASGELEETVKKRLKNEIVELVADRLKECGFTDQGGDIRTKLLEFLDLVYNARLPSTGERLIDSISIIDIRKILFDFARQMSGNDVELRQLHYKKNLKYLAKTVQLAKDAGDKDKLITAAFADGATLQFSPYSRNYLDEFYGEIEKAETLVIFSHRQQETVGLLYWINEVLKKNPSLKIKIIPQKSLWELNSTKQDILSVLQKGKGMKDLKRMHEQGRFIVMDDCAPGLSWIKGAENNAVREEIRNADILLGVGWDNFVSLQGLRRPCYFAFAIDDPIKQELTGGKDGEPIFVKTCGGITAVSIGRYKLCEYLENTNNEVYRILLDFFGNDRERLHGWIKREAEKTGKKETEIMVSEKYSKEPAKYFSECALREVDSGVRQQALDLIANNNGRFGIEKDNIDSIKIGTVDIKIGMSVDCYFLPNLPAVVLVNGANKIILEVLKTEDEHNYIRIGDKAYRVEGTLNLRDLVEDPTMWIGNSELVEFYGAESFYKSSEAKRGPPSISMAEIPQDVLLRIPQTKPEHIYRVAIDFFVNPPQSSTLKLHYALIILSSPDLKLKVRGLEEMRKLKEEGNKVITDIIRSRRLSRVYDWVNSEVPSVDRDVFSLANFSTEQEKVLKVLAGGYLLRPPLVRMPGQGVSSNFHDSISAEIDELDILLARNNYAEGAGSVVLPDGRRIYITDGYLLLDLAKDLLQGQMLGAVRLKKDDSVVVQVPENAGILNYLKIIHHMAHIMGARFVESNGDTADPLQEFTPTIEDVLLIKYAQKIAGDINDGFSDFQTDIYNCVDEQEIRDVFARYGLTCPVEKNLDLVKDEILKLKSMPQFADYIENNGLGNFISVKELLNVLVEYMTTAVKGYIGQLPQSQSIIVEKLLIAFTDEHINSLLMIASLLSGYHIPKIKFEDDVKIAVSILNRPGKEAEANKADILQEIDWILATAEPVDRKAMMITDVALNLGIGVNVGPERKKAIEESIADLLSGRQIQSIESLIQETIAEMEANGFSEEQKSKVEQLREDIEHIRRYRYEVGMTKKAPQPKPPEIKPKDIDRIDRWGSVVDAVRQSRGTEHEIKRVFCDIDKTIIDAPGFLTTTPWFGEMIEREGLTETIRVWRELEEKILERGGFHLMEDGIPQFIKELQDMGVEVVLYTARDTEDVSRTRKILEGLGIHGLQIITSKGGKPEQKRDALIEYYKSKDWFDKEPVYSLYVDDTLGNLKAVCSEPRFKDHIKGLWYRVHYQKQYNLPPTEYIEAGRKAVLAGRTMEALEWFYNAFYSMNRKDLANMCYGVIAEQMQMDACVESVLGKFINKRINGYKSAFEKQGEWLEVKKEKSPEKKQIKWVEGAPDIASAGFLEGIKRVIVIGSHPHGDHVKGFKDFAKRELPNLVETVPPGPQTMKTGGVITHSLSNYWGRIGDETIVLFDLGWFPEGFVDPLIQTINPRETEILFIMDPRTADTLDFKKQIEPLQSKGVKLQILPYSEIIDMPVEEGRLLQIENYPAYHLDPEVGSSIYIVRIMDSKSGKELYSIGYISELGDTFTEKIDSELLEKISRLDRIIVDGTNIVSSAGEGPLPLKGRPNKIYQRVKELNEGRFLISHINTTSIRMGESAKVAAENLDPNVPIIIIGGKDSIDQLKRSYSVPKGRDYYMLGSRRVYLIYDITGFHAKLREEGIIPKLEDIINERVKGLRNAGWTEPEITQFVKQWEEAEAANKDIKEYKGPEGKVKEIDALMWDLRKTKAVVISSSQFRGDPTSNRYKNFKGFQILDSIVDKKDASILIEGRLHFEGEEGIVLRVLLGQQGQRKIRSITGEKEVKADISNQWRSGHITFRTLMELLNMVADKSTEIGNVYNSRIYIPVPRKEWLDFMPGNEMEILLRKYERKSVYDVIDIVARWNTRQVVKDEEIRFAKKVLKRLFKDVGFCKKYFGLEHSEEFSADLIKRLDRIERNIRLKGRANNRVFIASTSKFVEVLRGVKTVTGKGAEHTKRLRMDPEDFSILFRTANRFSGCEMGVSYEVGKTIDLVERTHRVYSRDILKDLNRNYLRELYSLTEKGKIPPDLSRYREQKQIERYRYELAGLMAKSERQAKRKDDELFGVWFGRLKKYIESQYLRIGLMYVDGVAPGKDIRKELSLLYDAVIESIYDYLQEDMGREYKDIIMLALGDYAQNKTLFKDTIYLGIITKDETADRYVTALTNRMKGMLNKLGIPVEFKDWKQSLHRRAIIAGFEDTEKRLEEKPDRDLLKKKGGRLKEGLKILNAKAGFDVHTGPGGLEDIELIRYFYGAVLTNDDKAILDEAEYFLRLYRDEVGYSTGGDKTRMKQVFNEVMENLGFKDPGRDFKKEFFEKVWCAYMVLQKYMGTGVQSLDQVSVKNISFGDVEEEKDIHKGTFEEAAKKGRLFTKDMISDILDPELKSKMRTAFKLVEAVINDINNDNLKKRKISIIVEESGNPTMFYRDDPFASVLSHSGKRTGTIYLGLNTLIFAQKPEHRDVLRSLLLHENRDIERGYHMDLEDEVREGYITHKEIDGIYSLWNDLITNGRYLNMYNLYMQRAQSGKYNEYLLDRIPANIRIIKGGHLYEFKHGDVQNLPDYIGLNKRLFENDVSPETAVFLLRHCADKIRYDRYKAIINDIKYLVRLKGSERRKILSELKRLSNELQDSRYSEYLLLLEEWLGINKSKLELTEKTRKSIRDYLNLRFDYYSSPDGARVWYSVGGNLDSKRTLVFLHGIGVNSRDWRHQITLFERDYKIIAIDLRGLGKSTRLGRKPPHIKNYAEDVEGILEKEGIDDAVVVGHSMGGMVALNMEEIYGNIPLEKRRIKGLVLISTIAGDPTRSFFSPQLKKIGPDHVLRFLLVYFSQLEPIWDNSLFKWLAKRRLINLPFKKIAERWIIQKGTHPLFTRKVVKSVFNNEMQDLLYAFKSIMTNDVEDRLGRISIPVLWVVGGKDKVILPKEQEEDAEEIKNCKMVRIRDSKHYPHAEFPRRVNKAIYNFINSGTYRFSQLVCDSVKREYLADVSLDAIETDLNSLKMRLVPKLRGIEQDDLRLRIIEGIARTVVIHGAETGVANEVMIKAVLIIASQVISEITDPGDLARPIKLRELEDRYQEVVRSV